MTYFQNSRIPASVSVITLFVVMLGLDSSTLAQEKWTKFEAPTGELKNFGKALDLIEVIADGQHLKPKYVKDSNEGIQKFGDMMSKIRDSGGSGASTSGNQKWSTHNRGEKFNASAGFGLMSRSNPNQGGKNTFWVKASESDETDSTLLIEAKEDGTLHVDLTTGNGEFLFRFRQSNQGIVYCQELGQSNLFSGSGQTFDEFCQRHPDYVQKRLEPIFVYIGLGAPPNRYSDIVARNVLAELRPVDQKRLEQFKAAIEGLNSDDFDAREKASQALQDRFSDWQEMIQTASNDTEYPLETRARLKKIFKNSVSEKEVEDLQIAQQGKLDADAPYLVWLLGRSSEEDFKVSESDKKRLVDTLEELTAIKNGNDLDKWKKWMATNQPLPTRELEASITTNEIISSKGSLDKAASHIKTLIRLKCKDGRLTIDRDHWAKPFAGKTIQMMVDEAQEIVKEKGLPADWFRAGGDFPIESVDYPHILFEAIKADFPAEDGRRSTLRPAYYSSSYTLSTKNREHRGKELTAKLGMHRSSGGSRRVRLLGGKPRVKVPKEEFLELEFAERTGDKRVFNFRENKDGSMVIVISFPEKDALIRIVQNKAQKKSTDNKFLVFDARGALAKRYAAENFLEFKSKEKEYFDSVLAPIMEKLEIEIEIEIDEPKQK